MTDMDIKLLLPQREPFLFVDRLLSTDQNKIIGVKTYDSRFPYYLVCLSGQRTVPGTILVESLVQCGGAGIAQAAGKDLWGLTALNKVRLRGSVRPDSTVIMAVKSLTLSSKIIRQSGVSYCEGKIILEATWSCLRFR